MRIELPAPALSSERGRFFGGRKGFLEFALRSFVEGRGRLRARDCGLTATTGSRSDRLESGLRAPRAGGSGSGGYLDGGGAARVGDLHGFSRPGARNSFARWPGRRRSRMQPLARLSRGWRRGSRCSRARRRRGRAAGKAAGSNRIPDKAESLLRGRRSRMKRGDASAWAVARAVRTECRGCRAQSFMP